MSSDDDGLSFQLEFYNTPYDGGNIPFPVTIYNTFFASNLVSIVWLDSNNNFISEHFIDTNAFTDLGSDNYLLRIEASSIPVNATKYIRYFEEVGLHRVQLCTQKSFLLLLRISLAKPLCHFLFVGNLGIIGSQFILKLKNVFLPLFP